MLVRDVMTRSVHTVGVEWPLDELRSFLLDRGISGAPVVDPAGVLVGVVSATDLMRSDAREQTQTTTPGYFASSLDRPLSQDELGTMYVEVGDGQTVGEVMTPVVFQAEEETPVAEVADMMTQGRIHRVVVTRDAKVVGIVSALDLVRVLGVVLRDRAA
jgi:CBS domain-containing protein